MFSDELFSFENISSAEGFKSFRMEDIYRCLCNQHVVNIAPGLYVHLAVNTFCFADSSRREVKNDWKLYQRLILLQTLQKNICFAVRAVQGLRDTEK